MSKVIRDMNYVRKKQRKIGKKEEAHFCLVLSSYL